MRKIAVISVLVLVGVAIGISYGYWQQATSLPDWYNPEANQPADASTPEASIPAGEKATQPSPRSANTITQQIQTASPGPIQAQLSAAEIDNLILASLSKTPQAQNTLPPIVKAVKTQIQRNTITTGAVLDLGKLAEMPPSRRTQLLQKILQILPQLQGQQVYVGVSGQLSVKNQQLQFSPDSKLQIGKVEFGLDETAQRMGVSRTQLEQQLTGYLQLPNLNLEQIDLTDQGAVITGNKK